jgi:hypothetical protein
MLVSTYCIFHVIKLLLWENELYEIVERYHSLLSDPGAHITSAVNLIVIHTVVEVLYTVGNSLMLKVKGAPSLDSSAQWLNGEFSGLRIIWVFALGDWIFKEGVKNLEVEELINLETHNTESHIVATSESHIFIYLRRFKHLLDFNDYLIMCGKGRIWKISLAEILKSSCGFFLNIRIRMLEVFKQLFK